REDELVWVPFDLTIRDVDEIDRSAQRPAAGYGRLLGELSLDEDGEEGSGESTGLHFREVGVLPLVRIADVGSSGEHHRWDVVVSVDDDRSLMESCSALFDRLVARRSRGKRRRGRRRAARAPAAFPNRLAQRALTRTCGNGRREEDTDGPSTEERQRTHG